ncbi:MULTISPECIES: WS/DGAT/MGAT family O-acyltransferase [Marinobacter]|uniref:diacylglycerol O-acyltransferase n=1 Tax=Marinobacter excellens LAMA 842 TaxID=1306954 RepID=A0A137SEA5_9GAMM|nr:MULTISPECIES: wax ester/triacylglycerol synthase family O-acyltransferase [Marinobacter]KXO10750.1 Wax ester synthase/acyl-CoA:diacylglycerol acyltransferase [Marinobacter excellens LAMA 842]KXO11414.1 Wax ester synthase/acyl-CoA:diacylglycerol acyltransferase [Marinobacter excellens LAMA 842]MCD1629163.1 wax ester/triacylglycerol synthase family O-acyltransferase [Marinobacter shengliensis]
MKPLSPTDQLFLWLEKRQQPMHVGGLQLFSFPEGAPDDYVAQLAEELRQKFEVTPPFNQRLSYKLGQPMWVEDEHLDLEHHFRFEALPTPGRIRELLAFVSAEHSHLMDRERPMWEVHLIEGLKDRQFAIYTKIHHSLVDGVSAMRMATRMLSDNPQDTGLPPIWDLPRKARPDRDDPGSSLWHSITHLLGMSGKQLGTIPTVAKELLKTINQARKDPAYDSIFHAPRSVLNQKITGSRRFAAQSYCLTRIKSVCEAYGTTINDVVTAMCASALRTYLMNQDALPEKPLIAFVPVSLHRDDSTEGNQVGVILANLHTDETNAGQRLLKIHHGMQEAKDRYRHMSPEEIINYTALTLAPAAFHLLTGMAPKWQTFNVVISNVPGPSSPRYWNGAKLEGMYPVSIAMDRMALNMTLISYNGQVEFGLIGCRRTLPSLQRMLDYLEDGLAELEIAAGL